MSNLKRDELLSAQEREHKLVEGLYKSLISLGFKKEAGKFVLPDNTIRRLVCEIMDNICLSYDSMEEPSNNAYRVACLIQNELSSILMDLVRGEER